MSYRGVILEKRSLTAKLGKIPFSFGHHFIWMPLLCPMRDYHLTIYCLASKTLLTSINFPGDVAQFCPPTCLMGHRLAVRYEPFTSADNELKRSEKLSVLNLAFCRDPQSSDQSPRKIARHLGVKCLYNFIRLNSVDDDVLFPRLAKTLQAVTCKFCPVIGHIVGFGNIEPSPF